MEKENAEIYQKMALLENRLAQELLNRWHFEIFCCRMRSALSQVAHTARAYHPECLLMFTMSAVSLSLKFLIPMMTQLQMIEFFLDERTDNQTKI